MTRNQNSIDLGGLGLQAFGTEGPWAKSLRGPAIWVYLGALRTRKKSKKHHVGALMIRIGFSGIFYYNHRKEPPK